MSIEFDSAPEAENPESAAPAVHPFAAVPDTLHAALARKGFEKLTTVQSALLAADDGVRDLRISSQTGSGKTVAIGFALARDLHDDKRRGPTTLIVAPTRELASQVAEELSWLFADLRGCICEVVTGGTNIGRERMRLARRPEVLVGTPGRLLDHIKNGALDLSSVRQLVLDEADQMLDLGFKDELDAILSHLPEQRRTHLVSATFAAAVVDLADRFQNKPILVAGQKPGTAHADSSTSRSAFPRAATTRRSSTCCSSPAMTARSCSCARAKTPRRSRTSSQPTASARCRSRATSRKRNARARSRRSSAAPFAR